MGGILGWSWSTGSNALHFEDEPASSLLLGSWALMRCCFCSSSATKERSNMYTDTHIEDPVITQQEECKLYKRGGISYSNPWSHIKKKKNWEEAKAYMQVKLIHIYIYIYTWGSWGGNVWKEDAPMLTESRLAQCPHLTVTMVSKLLHGTLTCMPFCNPKKQIRGN